MFTKLKCHLMPYLYRQAIHAQRTGVPVMRAMLLEFPDDPTCDYLDRQYMLGESLLVAPVFAEDGAVTYYLPTGRWTRYLTGEVVVGGRWVREKHGLMSVPLLVRPDTVLAVGSDESRPDYDYADGITLELYELADGHASTVEVPDLAGGIAATFTVRREAGAVRVERQGDTKPWQVLLVGVAQVDRVYGGHAEPHARGTLVTASGDVDEVNVQLQAES
jgi:alpha-D-xyloside xylohydrolase